MVIGDLDSPSTFAAASSALNFLAAFALPEAGFLAVAFFAAMDGPEVDAGLQDDLALGRKKLARSGLPTVNVNQKLVARWDIEGERVLERILTAAAGETWKEDR